MALTGTVSVLTASPALRARLIASIPAGLKQVSSMSARSLIGCGVNLRAMVDVREARTGGEMFSPSKTSGVLWNHQNELD